MCPYLTSKILDKLSRKIHRKTENKLRIFPQHRYPIQGSLIQTNAAIE